MQIRWVQLTPRDHERRLLTGFARSHQRANMAGDSKVDKEAPVRVLDADDIALLKTYGTGPYANKVRLEAPDLAQPRHRSYTRPFNMLGVKFLPLPKLSSLPPNCCLYMKGFFTWKLSSICSLAHFVGCIRTNLWYTKLPAPWDLTVSSFQLIHGFL